MSGSLFSRRLVSGAYRGAAAGLDLLGLKAAVRRHVLPRLLAAAQGSADEQGGADRLERAALATVEADIRAALAAPGKILVGPWTSEVGFELLYWIPFLSWLREHFQVPADRLVAVTRGGAGVWYSGLCGDTVELFDLVSPDEFREHTARRWQDVGGQKQIHVDDWDGAILDRVRTGRSGIGEGVLHPYLMYALFFGVWQGRLPSGWALARTRFAPLAPPPAELAGDLPETFTAVRFYFRPSLPDTPENRRVVAGVVERLAARAPVVLLNPGLEIDDHRDWLPAGGHGLLDLSTRMTPATNLAVQSAALARCSAFVGTYGGLSYLAPLYGRPSIALRSERTHTLAVHAEVAEAAAGAAGGSLAILEPAHLDILDAIWASPVGRVRP